MISTVWVTSIKPWSLPVLRRPAFDFWSFDFDGSAAVAADEVVVVLVAGAATVASFAVIASEGVELAGVGERSHLVVDGGEGDVLALSLELGVKLLSGAEPVGGLLGRQQGRASAASSALGAPDAADRQRRRRSPLRLRPEAQWSSQWPSWEAWRCPSWT